MKVSHKISWGGAGKTKQRFYTDNNILLNVYFVLNSVPDTCHFSIYSHTTTTSFTEKKTPKFRERVGIFACGPKATVAALKL